MESGTKFEDSITFPSSSDKLVLVGHGITDMTIETIQVIFTKIAVYFEPSITEHLKSWKGKSVDELVKEGSGFHKELLEGPVKKLIKVVLVKSQKGSQYASTIETSIRDKLAYEDRYEDEEEAALSELVEFFHTKSKLEPSTEIVYCWPSTNEQVEVSVHNSGPFDGAHLVRNKHVAWAFLDWFLGENTPSQSTVESIAQTIVA